MTAPARDALRGVMPRALGALLAACVLLLAAAPLAAQHPNADERALAVRPASTDDDALARTFAERGVAAAAPWHDFVDAAAGMLDPASVERAVARLPRTSLVALFAALDGASLPASELAALRLIAERSGNRALEVGAADRELVANALGCLLEVDAAGSELPATLSLLATEMARSPAE